MSLQERCPHETAYFHSVQQLGELPPTELWHCPTCKSTVSAETLGKNAGLSDGALGSDSMTPASVGEYSGFLRA